MMKRMKLKVYGAIYGVKERVNAALCNEDGV